MIYNLDIIIGAIGMAAALLFKSKIKSFWPKGFIIIFLSQLFLFAAGIIRIM